MPTLIPLSSEESLLGLNQRVCWSLAQWMSLLTHTQLLQLQWHWPEKGDNCQNHFKPAGRQPLLHELEQPSSEALLDKLILIGQRIQEQFRLTAGTGQAINSPAAPCRDQELQQLHPEQGLSGQTTFHCTIKGTTTLPYQVKVGPIIQKPINFSETFYQPFFKNIEAA